MKKPYILVPAVLALVFAAFTLGFFLGRNANHSQVQISTAALRQGEAVPEDIPTSPASEAPAGEVIDLNTATYEQLITLPGIGDVIARRILEFRESRGGFRSVEELLYVEGIGTQKFETILDLITVGG